MSGLETHHDPLAKLNGKQKKTVSFDPMANITGSGGAANKAPNPFAKDATPVSNIPGYNEDDSEKEDDFMSVADILKNLGDLTTDGTIDDVLGDTQAGLTEKYLESIDDLKIKVEGSRIEDAVGDFVSSISDEVVMCASMGLDEVHAIENMQAQQTLDRVSKESDVHRRRLEEITLHEMQAKTRVTAKKAEIEKLRRQLEQLMILQTRRNRDVLQAAFIKAESHLLGALKRRKGEIKTYYGDLTLADSRFSGHEGRRFRVDWSYSPQPIEIKIGRICGLRDRCPEGRYVMIASLYDKLGGQALRWHKLHGQEWHGSTVPFEHDGHATSVEMSVDQSLYAVAPSERDLRPGMVVIFELYILRGKSSASDHAVCWGAFPIVNNDFTVVSGKFKMPMLRGSNMASVSKHEDIQDLVKDDLDNWMCNHYFEIIKRPRYVGQQKEFEVELQYTSGILGYPDRENEEEDETLPTGEDGKKDGTGTGTGDGAGITAGSEGDAAKAKETSAESALLAATGTIAAAAQGDNGENPVLRRQSQIVVSSLDGEGDTDAVNADGEMADGTARSHVANEIRFSSPKEDSGLSYIIRLDKKDNKRFVLRPGMRNRKKPLTEQEARDKFTQSLIANGDEDEDKDGSCSRSDFITRQFLAEIGIKQAGSREFWVLIALLAITFWVRTYVHFLAQWMYLQAIEVPVAKFQPDVLSVTLAYHDNLLLTKEVIGVITLGTIGNMMVFVLMIAAMKGIQAFRIKLPNVVSLTVLAYGIETVLDPVLMLVQDVIYLRWEDNDSGTIGDAFKLYWHLTNRGDSGIAGILFTFFIDLVLMCVAASLVYGYYLQIHKNGELLSLYIRLNSEEDNFFMPDDAEISNTELNELVAKSERWRGPRGERRKIIVHKFVPDIKSDDEAGAADKKGKKRRDSKGSRKGSTGSTGSIGDGAEVDVKKLSATEEEDVRYSIAICTIDLDGDITPFRRFIVDNGAMREVFEDATKLLKNYREVEVDSK